MVDHVVEQDVLANRNLCKLLRLMARPSFEFRSNFLHVIASTNVDISQINVCSPTNVNADDRASCTPSRGHKERFDRGGLTNVDVGECKVQGPISAGRPALPSIIPR